MRSWRRWWGARTLRARMAVVVGLAAAVVLVVLGRLAVGVLASALVGAADAELERHAEVAVAQLAAGAAPSALAGPNLRVVDTAGQPVDGGPDLPLSAAQVREMAGGEALVAGGPDGLRRWVAAPAVLPDGSTRLVIVTGDVIGGTTLIARAAAAFVLAALGAAVVVGAAAWLGTRAALRPVDRMRAAAAALPPGERLPVPEARDELRALTEEINRLLARRDEAAARLERFTGDAAHELRSPVAAIRAQAEVAVAHPDPQMAEETLRAVAAEAVRLSSLLDDLLALARADAGQRPPAVAVDLVAAAGAAVARAGLAKPPDRVGPGGAGPDGDDPAVELVAPTPAVVAATPSEVALVLDNLIDNGRRHARSIVRVVVLPAGRWVRLSVEDDGPGIPEADRERVFDRFTRLRPEAGGGSGLGLALVAALVQGRGGTAVAGATPTGGARLEIRWRTPPADQAR
jgi:two-component system, OmpR family, sensor kinase